MKCKYPHVLAAFYGTPWMILPEKLREIEAVLRRRATEPLLARPLSAEEREQFRAEWARMHAGAGPGGEVFVIEPEAAFDDNSTETDAGYTIVGSAAILPIHGTISPRPSAFDDWSGGASAEKIGRAVDAAAADTRVEHLVIDIDSPGGSVFGLPETAGKIFAARKAKPVTAVANHVAASAAYWFATQAATIAVTPAGQVGSVGVIWAHTDWSKFEEQVGRKTTYITAGKYKAEGNQEHPLDDEARAEIQRVVDEYYSQFVAGVAKGRGVKPATVERDFGQGRMRLAQEAVELRMADRVATLEQVVSEINAAKTARLRRKVAADLAAKGLPTT